MWTVSLLINWKLKISKKPTMKVSYFLYFFVGQTIIITKKILVPGNIHSKILYIFLCRLMKIIIIMCSGCLYSNTSFCCAISFSSQLWRIFCLIDYTKKYVWSYISNETSTKKKFGVMKMNGIRCSQTWKEIAGTKSGNLRIFQKSIQGYLKF